MVAVVAPTIAVSQAILRFLIHSPFAASTVAPVSLAMRRMSTTQQSPCEANPACPATDWTVVDSPLAELHLSSPAEPPFFGIIISNAKPLS